MKLFSAHRSDGGNAVIWVFKPKCMWYPRVSFIHASPTGGPVPRDSAGLGTVAGVVLRIFQSTVWIQFRRFWRD